MKESSVFAKIAWFFTSRYRITALFWVIILVAGLFSYTASLKREGFPPVNLPIVAIQGSYFADNAKAVDNDVIEPMSASLETFDSIDEYQTSARTNFFTVFIQLNSDEDVQDITTDIETSLADNPNIPDSATYTVSAIEPAKFSNKYNLLLAVYDEKNSDYNKLEQKANESIETLEAAGEIDTATVVPVVETVNDPATGQKVERQTSINKVGVKQDGKIVYYPAVNIGITKVDTVDDIALSESVQEAISQLNSNPDFKNVEFEITADFATIIDEQIGSLQDNLLGGLIAVLIIALLLISWRAALVIALFIPTVMAGSFLGLELLGYTLNTITLFALILTLGLFVDDATIIVEAIDAHRKDSKSRKAAIKAAISRVGMASLAGTLTTILVFSPMLYVSGILGEFIRLLPITVILALVISFVVSIILVPFLSRPLVLGRGKKDSILDKLSILLPLEKRLSVFFGKLPLLNKTNKKKGRIVTASMVALSLVAIVGAGFFSNKLTLDIFPESKDSNILQAQVDFEPNTPIADAEKSTDSLDKQVRDTLGDELEYVSYTLADNQQAIIEIGLIPYTERDITSQDLISQLENEVKVDDVDLKFTQADAGPPGEDFPFQMRIYASNEETLDEASNQIKKFLQDTRLRTNTGEVAVAKVKVEGKETINRTAKGRFVTVLAQFEGDDAASGAVIAAEDAVKGEFDNAKLDLLGLTEDSLDFDVSQESENEESFNSIGIGLVVALALMYLLLVVLFNSFSQPLLIFMAIPFSLFGVFFGLWATDNAFSFFVMLGLLGLIGIVVNNSILLTEYANQEKQAGADQHDAISRAVKDRFRPLITTTLTTIFALLPLAMSDPFWQPLAFTLIFGMASSTTLIILAFPYYYLFFERIRDWKNKRFPGLM